MVKMNKECIDILNDPSALKVLATVDAEGRPNAVPKGSLTAIDEETIAFADIFGEKTTKNLETTKKVAIAVFKPSSATGYQVKGTFQEFNRSGPLFDKFAKQMKEKLGMDVNYVGIIKVEEVFPTPPKR